MDQQRRKILQGIGVATAGIGFTGTVHGRSRVKNTEGFGEPTYIAKQDIKNNVEDGEDEQLKNLLRQMRKADMLVVEELENEYKIQLSKKYFKNRIDHTGELTQEDYENSDFKKELEKEHKETKEQIKKETTKRALNTPVRAASHDSTIELGEDQHWDDMCCRRYTDYDSYEPSRVVSGYGPGAGTMPSGRMDVELMPTGGYGTTYAWCEAGTEFRTKGDTSHTAQFHAECKWEGYIAGAKNSTGDIDIDFRLYDLEHNSYEEQEYESYNIGNVSSTWHSDSKTVTITHQLQPNRTYRAVVRADASILVRVAGATIDFGQPEYMRGARPGVWPGDLDIEF